MKSKSNLAMCKIIDVVRFSILNHSFNNNNNKQTRNLTASNEITMPKIIFKKNLYL